MCQNKNAQFYSDINKTLNSVYYYAVSKWGKCTVLAWLQIKQLKASIGNSMLTKAFQGIYHTLICDIHINSHIVLDKSLSCM